MTTTTRVLKHAACLSVPLVLAACGGGGSSTSSEPPPPPTGDATRIAAATQTAQNNPACTALSSFYWEIGNSSGVLASGQVGSGAPGADTEMLVASASKWVFAAYAVEKKGGAALSTTQDVPYLNFTSGYSNFTLPTCPGLFGTVDDCLAGDRGTVEAAEAASGTYHYDSGHMQKYASNIGLGALNAAGLASEVMSTLGGDWSLSYADVQVAANVRTTAAQYARFLRKMLVGHPAPLRIATQLGSHAVCTLPRQCPNSAYSPSSEDWHYSLGHWVEDDAATVQAGNLAYSSAGSFGFYPWVSQDRSLYGIVARELFGGTHEGFVSATCGQLIRRAYVTATPI